MGNFPPQGFFGLPNLLRGIVPTISSWDVDPINLANSTDGNFSTATGIGSSTEAGTFGTVGTFTFDLGSIQTVIFGFKFGMDASAGNAVAHSIVSDDNITFTRNDVFDAQISSAVESIGYSTLSTLNGRYIQILIQNDTAGATVDFRLFEAYAFRVVI